MSAGSPPSPSLRTAREWGGVAVALAVALLAIGAPLLPFPLRVAAALAFALWAPGYVLLEALWPWARAPVEGPLERHALAVGISLALVPLVATPLFLLHALTAPRLVGSLAGLVLLLALAAALRRIDRPRLHAPRPAPDRLTGLERKAAALAAVALLAAAATTGWALASKREPRSHEAMLTDPAGEALPHPLVLDPGVPATVFLSVRAHGEDVTYAYHARLTIHPRGETPPAAPEIRDLDGGSIEVAAGDSDSVALRVELPSQAGAARLDVDLDAPGSRNDRRLVLFVEVKAE